MRGSGGWGRPRGPPRFSAAGFRRSGRPLPRPRTPPRPRASGRGSRGRRLSSPGPRPRSAGRGGGPRRLRDILASGGPPPGAGRSPGVRPHSSGLRGGGADGIGGGGSTKLEVIRSSRARVGASGIGADGSYNRSPESISAAERRLVTFVRSRIGRRTTHQPIWMAPYRNTRNGTVEKRVGTMPFCRTKVRNVGALWLFRNTRDHVARSAHIEGSIFRTARCDDVRVCDAATVTLSRFTMTDPEPLVTPTAA